MPLEKGIRELSLFQAICHSKVTNACYEPALATRSRC